VSHTPSQHEWTPAKGFLLCLLVILFLYQSLTLAWTLGETQDEAFYNGSVSSIVRNDYHAMGEHPPLAMQLGTLALKLFPEILFLKPHDIVYLGQSTGVDVAVNGKKFLYQSGNDPQRILSIERTIIVLVTLMGGWILFLWSRKLFGWRGGILSFSLFSLSPNLIAHGSLLTTDMLVSVCLFTSFYLLAQWMDAPTWKKGILTGVFFGLSFLSKASGLLGIPILFVVLASSFLIDENFRIRMQEIQTHERRLIGISFIVFVLSVGQNTLMIAAAPFFIGLWTIQTKRFFNTFDLKYLCRHENPQLIHIARLNLYDRVVRSGNRIGAFHTF